MLSVVIPSHNTKKTIEKCIRSIYSQKIKVNEIVLVDDCSSDGSIDIVRKKFPKVNIVRNEKRSGAAYSRNRGIKIARGNYVLIMDGDVCLAPNCIKKLLLEKERSDIIYPTVVNPNGKVFVPRSEEEEKFLRTSTIFMLKKENLKKMDELFDENYFIYHEDVDFFLRCYLFGLKSKHVKGALAYHLSKPSLNLEMRYYYEVKNTIYGLIKLSNVPKNVKKVFLFPRLMGLLSLISVLIRNENIFATSKTSKKISDSNLKLLALFLKAINWNILYLGNSLHKREKFNKSLKHLTFPKSLK